MWCWGYLYYENYKCWKELVAPLVKECTETVEEVKLADITFAENENENSYKCTLCVVYIVLLLIFFTINVSGIVTYCVYSQWYLKKMIHMLNLIVTKKQRFTKHINGKNQTN